MPHRHGNSFHDSIVDSGNKKLDNYIKSLDRSKIDYTYDPQHIISYINGKIASEIFYNDNKELIKKVIYQESMFDEERKGIYYYENGVLIKREELEVEKEK